MIPWIPCVAIGLMCACMASSARTAILPVDLEPKVGANYLPVGAEELAIWESLERLEETIRTSPQRVIAPELDAYTRGIIERLIGRPAPDLRIYLMHDASLNAAVLPTGMMIVNTGLLARVRNEAQLAAVLGHEVGHYFRKHSLDLHRDSRRKSAMADAAASALHSYSDSFGGWSLINQAITMSGFRFSRNLESEADAYGLMLMARAGYPPRAAFAMWRQVVDERQASAAARHKRFRDGTSSALSTHPPTEERMINLADTGEHLAGKQELAGGEGREEWAAVIRPFQAMLLREQVHRNDPGASLYLLANLAKDGWTGLLRFHEGEAYRLRNADGDERKAAAAYAAATALPDAPPEAWRAHGFALLRAGDERAGFEAMQRYLALKPDAADAAMIRLAVSGDRLTIADERGASGSDVTVKTGSPWKKLPASANRSRWEDVWTWNGPQLDRVTLVSGLPEGKAIVSQATTADQQVPVFRADMTAQDFASMIEASYRVNGVTVFEIESVEPADFLGGSGVRLRYRYVSGIAFTKKGSCVMRVIGRKLYAMKLESLAGQAFDTVAPEFDRLVASAELRGRTR